MNVALLMKLAELSIAAKQFTRLIDETTKLVTTSLEGVNVVSASDVAKQPANGSMEHLKAITDLSGNKPSKKGMIVKRFTPEEDKVIKAAIKKPDFNIKTLAKLLNRHTSSVSYRITTLHKAQNKAKAKESA